MSEYHARRSRVLTRLALMHQDEYADLLAYERTIEGLNPAPDVSQPAKCGTRSGYNRHKKNDEDACERCQEAARAYQLKWRMEKQ